MLAFAAWLLFGRRCRAVALRRYFTLSRHIAAAADVAAADVADDAPPRCPSRAETPPTLTPMKSAFELTPTAPTMSAERRERCRAPFTPRRYLFYELERRHLR